MGPSRSRDGKCIGTSAGTHQATCFNGAVAIHATESWSVWMIPVVAGASMGPADHATESAPQATAGKSAPISLQGVAITRRKVRERVTRYRGTTRLQWAVRFTRRKA